MEIIKIKTISTRVGEIFLRSDGIICHNFKDDIIIGIDDISELIKGVKEITKGKKHPMLVLPGLNNSTTKEAREVSLKQLKENDFALAEGFVINNLPTRLAFNFFYKIYKPNHPVKTFKKEDDAVLWLKSFMASE